MKVVSVAQIPSERATTYNIALQEARVAQRFPKGRARQRERQEGEATKGRLGNLAGIDTVMLDALNRIPE